MTKMPMLALAALVAVLAIPAAGRVPAPGTFRRIRIRVLNAKNGKPITNECLNISIGSVASKEGLLAGTDKRGVVVLEWGQSEVIAERPCRGYAASRTERRPGVGTLTITGDYYVACQEYAPPPRHDTSVRSFAAAFPAYPVARILKSGVVSSNTCGKARAKPRPGELIFFERPRTFWEKLTE